MSSFKVLSSQARQATKPAAQGLFKKTGRKSVKELLKTEHGREQYRREIRELRSIVPDMTEAQAKEAIAKRRRKGEVIDYKASAAEKSKFRDEFGKHSASSRLSQLTKLVNRRKEQNKAGQGDGETRVSAEGKAVANSRRDAEKSMSDSQRRKYRKLEAEYFREYKIAMGYAA
jgi:hypothetical protein